MRPLPPRRRSVVWLALLVGIVAMPLARADAAPAANPKGDRNVWTDVQDGYWAKGAIDLAAADNQWMQDYGPTVFQRRPCTGRW